jgi:predicted MFS family arabinose efflux permease
MLPAGLRAIAGVVVLLELLMLLPILLLSAAGFTVLTTEFIIVGLLPAIARDLAVSIPQAGLLVTLFAFTVAMFGPFLTAYFARFERRKLFISILIMFGLANTVRRWRRISGSWPLRA